MRTDESFFGKQGSSCAGNGGKMSYLKRPLEELNVMDDFLFSALANDPDVVRAETNRLKSC